MKRPEYGLVHTILLLKAQHVRSPSHGIIHFLSRSNKTRPILTLSTDSDQTNIIFSTDSDRTNINRLLAQSCIYKRTYSPVSLSLLEAIRKRPRKSSQTDENCTCRDKKSEALITVLRFIFVSFLYVSFSHLEDCF